MSSFVKLLGSIALVGAIGCDEAAPGGAGAGGDAGGESVGTASTTSGDAPQGAGGAGGDDATGTGGDASGPSSTGSGGEAGGPPVDPCPSYASQLVEVTYGPGAGFGQDEAPGIVLGPPRGGGCCQGSLDVLSLGNGGAITLGFHDTVIVDGDGPDFTVFENPFFAGGDPASPFVELGTVEVSADGETWHAFPCATLEAPWDACAGVSPVLANADENEVDPRDPAVSGGDTYDLADVGLPEARWVRIVDRADHTGFGGVFDLDAVAVVNGRCDGDAGTDDAP